MSATDAALLARVDALLAKGQAVAATEHSSGSVRMVEWGVYQEWRTQSLSALVAVVGANHAYPAEFARIINSNSPVTVTGGMGILRALREDIANGYLRRLEALVSADVFTDFLDMAQHLLDTDYKDPAASLTGAVLEDGLRRIATAKGITFTKGDGLAKLNEKCAKAGVYNALTMRQVAVWTEIRNKADHGHFKEYAAADVAGMVSGVSGFLAMHV